MGIRDAWRGLQTIGRLSSAPAPEKKESAVHRMMMQALPNPVWRTGKKVEKYYTEGYQQNIIVYRCVSLIAEAAATAPPIIFRGDQQLDFHPALDLFQSPNPNQSGRSFREAVFAFDLLTGESFQEGVGPATGAPRELYTHRPDRVQLDLDQAGEVAGYTYEVNNRKHRFSPREALHVRRFNPMDPLRGQSPLAAAARSADSHNEATAWNMSVLQNGAKPSGALQQKADSEPLNDEQFSRLKTEIEEQFAGSGNAGRPLLLEGGLEWVQMMLTQSDLDWHSGKQMSAGEIALAYDVPEQLVGVPGQQTYNNYREARLALYEDAVLPLLDRYYERWTEWFRELFNDPRITLTYDVDQIPALSLRRERTWDKVQNADFLTINEQREAVGYEPIDGGDVIFVGAGQLPLSFAATDPLPSEQEQRNAPDYDSEASIAYGDK